MTLNKKITENELISRLREMEELLAPMRLGQVEEIEEGSPDRGYDAHIVGTLPDSSEEFRFLVEVKASNTPQVIYGAISQVRTYKRSDEHPMLLVPYLALHNLELLEREAVSGIDLCGNGIVTIPGRVLIYRTGNKNLYPESRPVSNPFQGKTAMVARAFFTEPVVLSERTKFVDTLGELHQMVVNGGTKISISQVSKAVSALEDERLLGSAGRSIYILDPDQIMDRLANAWKPVVNRRIHLRLNERMNALTRLNQSSKLKWAITGESSASHHTPFAQGGAIRVAVSRMDEAVQLLGGEEEQVPNFADIELLETDEPGYFFQNKVDAGLRWASPLQTWIELKNGDARQLDAAMAVRNLIIPHNSR